MLLLLSSFHAVDEHQSHFTDTYYVGLLETVNCSIAVYSLI